MSRVVCFEVIGEVEGLARHRSFYNKKLGRPQTYSKQQPWRDHCSLVCQKNALKPLMTGPVLLLCEFRLPRRKTMPKREAICHTTRPDVSNCLKLIEDEMKGRIFAEDALVVCPFPAKRYARPDEVPGVSVQAIELDRPPVLALYLDGSLVSEVNLASHLDGAPPGQKKKADSTLFLPLKGEGK